MTAARTYGIVCAGGGPRAAAGLRARFPRSPFRYAGPPAGAPFGIVADPSLPAALRALDAEIAIVVHPEVGLDPASAAALAAAADAPATLVAPVLTDASGRIASAGNLLVCDPVRERARAFMPAAGATLPALAAAAPPRAFDGRCIAARTETLRAHAPELAEPHAWLAASAAARLAGVRLVVADVAIAAGPQAVMPPSGDDPRDAAAESRLVLHASPSWSGFAADAALGRATRAVRAFYGQDVTVVDPAPRATVVVAGVPSDRAAFSRALLANALAVDEVIYAGSGDDAHELAASALRNRGDRYVAFVDAATTVQPGWFDALVAALERDELSAFATFAAAGVDARATVVAAARIPGCEPHAFETLHGVVADLALRVARDRGRGVVRVEDELCALPPPVEDAAFRARYGCAPSSADAAFGASEPRFSGIASIVMLSWNAPEFTRMAVESIRAVTRYPHEIIVVDNGSDEATRHVLAALEAEHGIRTVYNGRNLGFGGGMNVGMAHARGDVVVILNNDVLVTEGWLEDLVGALELRRTVGCTAPRSNRVASAQQVNGAYADTEEMHRFAAERRRSFAGRGFLLDRVVGFCLCLDRKVIDQVGGFDPLYGMGNFEDDDLCVRMRAAGWATFVCDDVFIHHFGSASFKANSVAYLDLMTTNWRSFCAKWGLGDVPLYTPYDPRALARRGDVTYVPLPEIA